MFWHNLLRLNEVCHTPFRQNKISGNQLLAELSQMQSVPAKSSSTCSPSDVSTVVGKQPVGNLLGAAVHGKLPGVAHGGKNPDLLEILFTDE